MGKYTLFLIIQKKKAINIDYIFDGQFIVYA